MRIALCEKNLRSSRIVKSACDDILRDKNLEYEFVEYTSAKDLFGDPFPDVLFLEIEEMGLIVRDILAAMHAETNIIFLSEDKEQVLEAFGKNVYGYLVYPLVFRIVHLVMHSSILECLERKNFLYCKHKNNIEKIFFQDILFIQAYGRYTKIFVRGESEYRLCDKSIGDWAESVQNLEFASPHRSYIVNLRYVEKIQKKIQLLDGKEVPISQGKKKTFYQRIGKEKREENFLVKK